MSYGDMSKYLAKDQIAGITFLIDNGYGSVILVPGVGAEGYYLLMLTRNAKYLGWWKLLLLVPILDYMTLHIPKGRWGCLKQIKLYIMTPQVFYLEFTNGREHT